MEYKVSIIIPVYGVEKYLKECLDSVINQTYSNLEIILIDDESPDQCPVICDEYALKDNRIKVIHKKNGGAGSARNAGLKICTGEYICFVDSDDYVYPDYVEVLLEQLIKNNADISVVNYMYLFKDGLVENDFLMQERDYTSTEYLKEFLNRCNSSLMTNKLFKRNVLKNLFFVEGRRIDDEFFTYQAVMRANRITQTSKNLYIYRMRASGVMRTAFNYYEKILGDQIDYFTERYHKVIEKYPELKKDYLENLMDNMIHWKRQTFISQDIKKRVQKIIKKYFIEIIFGPATMKKKYIFIRSIWFSKVIEPIPFISEEDNQNLFD